MKASHSTRRNVLQLLAAIPAVFAAVVSHFVACPACWPLVGGLISALGLTSLLETRLMVPLFVDCLLLAIAPLALQARHHLPPFILGLIASAFVLVGKFLLNAIAVTVAGIAILIAAYLWSYRERRPNRADASLPPFVTMTTPPKARRGVDEDRRFHAGGRMHASTTVSTTAPPRNSA